MPSAAVLALWDREGRRASADLGASAAHGASMVETVVEDPQDRPGHEDREVPQERPDRAA
jgi:hypothetical protein